MRPRGDAQQQLSTEREADRVTGLVGEHALDRLLQIRIRGRVVRCLGRPVPEHVDGDDAPSGIGEQVDPTCGPPSVLERRTQAMHKDHWLAPRQTHMRSVAAVSVWQEVGDGCYRRRYERYDVNVAVVRGSDGLLLFDTRGSPVQGDELRRELAELDRRPVRHIVNSHWHFDHVLGNQCFTGHVEPARWGHPGLNEMFDRHREMALEWACRYDVDLAGELGDLVLTLPNRAVASHEVVDLGDRVVELVHYGRGHTGHDVVAHVRSARVLLAGDLLEESAPPAYAADCFPIAWANTVTAMLDAADEATTIVPGHGDTMTTALARTQADAIAIVARTIRALHTAGEPPEQALDAATEQWPFPTHVLHDALHRGYAELDGTAE